MIRFKQKGNFSKTKKYFNKIKDNDFSFLEKYALEGVHALSSRTPIDSGETAASWYYEIENQNGTITIRWCNSHLNEGVKIAVILQYGHATGNGGYFVGTDYINPALKPIFDKITEQAWKEITRS